MHWDPGTETHLDSSVNSSELFPHNFSVFRKDREGRSKGGVCIAVRDDLIATHRTDLDSECEAVWVTLKVKGVKDLTIGAFYRSQIFGDSSEYLDALRQSLTKIRQTTNGPVWLAGDFNFPAINWENQTVKPEGPYAILSRQMLNIAQDFGLEQIVREPTRKKNILDLFLTSNPTLVEKSCVVPGISDHDGIPVIVMNTRPKYIKTKPRKVYKYGEADIDGLKKELQNWSTEFIKDTSNQTSVNSMFDQFQKAIESAMEKFIPSKMVTKRNKCPWLTKRVKRLHKRKQRAYNSHKRIQSDESYEKFKKIRQETTKETRRVYRKHVRSVCSESLKKFYTPISKASK